jgi:hypothetical protein
LVLWDGVRLGWSMWGGVRGDLVGWECGGRGVAVGWGWGGDGIGFGWGCGVVWCGVV